MKTYFWDFFGPRAEGTAAHFHRHLLQFLDQHQLSGCETALVSDGPGHHGVSCRTPAAARATIEGALRPRRSSEDEVA
jgi:hypothetical protein